MARSCLALVLAAGEGTRMRSSLPKVMHCVAGIPMLEHVLNVSRQAGCNDIAVVTGKGAELVASHTGKLVENAQTFVQTERLGTAHAVLSAHKALEEPHDDILVLFGDTPLVTVGTLQKMREELERGAAIVVLGFNAVDPTGYGRLIVEDGKLLAIREHREASEDERRISFCNGGIMAFAGDHALSLIERIDNQNAKGEYYLTDAVEIANAQGLSVIAVEASETEVMGVDNRQRLAEAERLWQQRKRLEVMADGVTLQAPETVFFHADTVIEPDVVIEPNVVFGPAVKVSSGARIRSFSHLEGAAVGKNAEIGPYARLRPGTRLGTGTKIGNFVETKNANLHEGAKVNHLSYIGDAEVGKKANIGAGTITCNYDGMNKHKTNIGANSFVGSNSSLVAPVTIGDGAYIASGSVITENVPDDAMAVARGRQTNKKDHAKAIRARTAKLKAERS